jgi:hypothetical protein
VVSVPKIHLRAEIVIEFDAADFVEAASHQGKLAHAVAALRHEYPEAKLSIRERRPRGPKQSELKPTSIVTGSLRAYR